MLFFKVKYLTNKNLSNLILKSTDKTTLNIYLCKKLKKAF
jgi:hypothetical protein